MGCLVYYLLLAFILHGLQDFFANSGRTSKSSIHPSSNPFNYQRYQQFIISKENNHRIKIGIPLIGQNPRRMDQPY